MRGHLAARKALTGYEFGCRYGQGETSEPRSMGTSINAGPDCAKAFSSAAFAARADIVDIDSTELAKLAAAGVPVIDIRTRPEWEETGIVPGSHLLTFFDERGRANPAAWLERAKEIARPGEPLVVVCRSGNRTKALSQFLSQQAGYAKVCNVRNGIQAWAKEGRPMVSAAPVLAACRAARTC